MKRNIDSIALIILIAAAVNCGLIGIFRFNVMTWLFNGQSVAASRMVYVLVAVAGLWCTNLIAVQGYRNHTMRNVAPDSLRRSGARFPTNNPAGEPVCSPYVSQGCIDEDIDLSMIIEEEDEHDNY